MSDIRLKIKDLPESERPIERLLKFGSDALSNAELLAIILRSGIKGENVLTLSNKLVTEFQGINGLLSCSFEDLKKVSGIGNTKAAQILALAELSKRFKSYKSDNKFKVSSPQDAAAIVMEEMRYLKQETLKVIMLNTKNLVIKIKDVSLGSLNSSIVHPREVFIEPIKTSSASIIICHNHPSGDPTPSSEDISITNRLKECGKLLGIELLDHIIIGDGIYTSLKEKGIL